MRVSADIGSPWEPVQSTVTWSSGNSSSSDGLISVPSSTSA